MHLHTHTSHLNSLSSAEFEMNKEPGTTLAAAVMWVVSALAYCSVQAQIQLQMAAQQPTGTGTLQEEWALLPQCQVSEP